MLNFVAWLRLPPFGFGAAVKSTPTATTRHRSWTRFVVPVGWMLAIYIASDQPRLPSPPGVPHVDKIAHFCAYGLLATLWVRALAVRWPLGRAALFAWIVTAAYGATDEFHQAYVPGRSLELADWLADSSGAATAVLLFTVWPAWRALLEHPLVRRRGASSSTETAAAAAARDSHS